MIGSIGNEFLNKRIIKTYIGLFAAGVLFYIVVDIQTGIVGIGTAVRIHVRILIDIISRTVHDSRFTCIGDTRFQTGRIETVIGKVPLVRCNSGGCAFICNTEIYNGLGITSIT